MSLTGEQHISKTINLLRFPLMLLVVCMHFSGGGDNTTLLYCNLMQFGLIYLALQFLFILQFQVIYFGKVMIFFNIKIKFKKEFIR